MIELMRFWFFSAALLAGAGWCLSTLLRTRGYQVRGVWLSTLVLSILAPVLPRLGSFEPAGAVPLIADGPTVSGAVTIPFTVAPDPFLLTVATPWIWAAWAGLSAALLLVVVGAVWTLRQRSQRWRATRVGQTPVWAARDFGPAVVGVRRPRIVVPEALLEADPADLDLVLTHEEEHVEARDPALLWFAALAVVAMPWNLPLLWQARQLRATVEEDCDLRVLRRGTSPRAYGDLLVRMATRPQPHGFAFAALAERKSGLRRRLELLRDRKGQTRTAVTALLVIAGATSVGVWMGLPSPLEIWHDGEPEYVSLARVHTAPAVPSVPSPPTPAFLLEFDELRPDAKAELDRARMMLAEARLRAEEVEVRIKEAQERSTRIRNGVPVITMRSGEHIRLEAERLAVETELARAQDRLNEWRDARARAPRIRLRAPESSQRSADGAEPIVIVNGERFEGTVRKIRPEWIDRVEVLKGPPASALYGEDAANGVVQIYLKEGFTVDGPPNR